MEDDFPENSSIMFSQTPEAFYVVHIFDKGYAPFINVSNNLKTMDNVEHQTGGRVEIYMAN